MGKLLVIGSLNMDMALRVPHIPARGETILAQGLRYAEGGKGANQAFTLGKLGASVAMLGSVGRDANGERLLANLRSVGVDVSLAQRLENEVSGLAVIAVEGGGDNNIIVAPGANLRTGPDYIKASRQAISQCDAVIMQLEIPLESVALAAKMAKAMGKLVILDPAPATVLPEGLYRDVDIVKPNETELAILSGLPVGSVAEMEEAARVLLGRGAGTVVVTMGAGGALIARPSGCLHVPVPTPVKVVDTTAAGDSFTAAMAMMLVEGRPLEDAVRFAELVAGVVVGRPGAQSSIPDAQEVEALKRGLAAN